MTNRIIFTVRLMEDFCSVVYDLCSMNDLISACLERTLSHGKDLDF